MRSGTATREGAMSPPLLIAWGVMIEIFRRKEFYVLLIIMSLFGVGVLISRMSTENTPESGAFIVNLGMSMAFLFSAILVIITSGRQLPAEFEQRTIYPLLAKPVTRAQLLVGKWIATSATAVASMLILFLIAYLPSPKSPDLSGLLLLQALLAKAIGLALLGALGILFSLLLPKALNLVLLAMLYTGSGVLANFIRAKALKTSGEAAINWVVRYIPNFDLLDLAKRYADGAPAVSGPQFLGMVGYGIVATIFLLSVSCLIFDRRTL
ncbi:hypothetical protein BH09SUM1_BH09SUM1_00230 [soil metagenome]